MREYGSIEGSLDAEAARIHAPRPQQRWRARMALALTSAAILGYASFSSFSPATSSVTSSSSLGVDTLRQKASLRLPTANESATDIFNASASRHNGGGDDDDDQAAGRASADDDDDRASSRGADDDDDRGSSSRGSDDGDDRSSSRGAGDDFDDDGGGGKRSKDTASPSLNPTPRPTPPPTRPRSPAPTLFPTTPAPSQFPTYAPSPLPSYTPTPGPSVSDAPTPLPTPRPTKHPVPAPTHDGVPMQGMHDDSHGTMRHYNWTSEDGSLKAAAKGGANGTGGYSSNATCALMKRTFASTNAKKDATWTVKNLGLTLQCVPRSINTPPPPLVSRLRLRVFSCQPRPCARACWGRVRDRRAARNGVRRPSQLSSAAQQPTHTRSIGVAARPTPTHARYSHEYKQEEVCADADAKTKNTNCRDGSQLHTCAQRELLAALGTFSVHYFTSDITPEGPVGDRVVDWVDLWTGLHANLSDADFAWDEWMSQSLTFFTPEVRRGCDSSRPRRAEMERGAVTTARPAHTHTHTHTRGGSVPAQTHTHTLIHAEGASPRRLLRDHSPTAACLWFGTATPRAKTRTRARTVPQPLGE